MTGHMTADAVAIAMQAYEHATRLGHPYLGGEHGVTPGRAEAEIIRLSGGGARPILLRPARQGTACRPARTMMLCEVPRFPSAS